MLYCCYGDKRSHEKGHNLVSNERTLFDIIIVAGTDKDL